MQTKRVAQVEEECVACGNCAKCCPFGAITVYKGLHAVVDEICCKGCGKCVVACPADVIVCKKREVESA
ncbi:MAG: 4Fe-4S binding protein [Christensenella sp.]|uniref:4Fe-4S binding protein n=1 Tax=Christensenella sp. TaxID=1935934 RepID=UPI002B1EBC19|nr:4Fe-4S binding protein [Christensenella sp.]MEA5003216.1 4Fe-4S binding protein [Christensenella sp.]